MSEVQQFENLVDMATRSVARFADRKRFATKVDGQWKWLSYGEFGTQIDAFRGGLAQLGVGKGDAVAVIANNRVEWAVGAYATYGREARYVPMYEKQNAEDWRFILTDSGAKVVLVANEKIATVVRGFAGDIGTLEKVIVLDGEGADTFAAVMAIGKDHPVQPGNPESTDLAGLIYTSGTTGQPKGVKLSHGNFISNVNAVQALFPMRDDEVSLSFLPWAHSFGQTCELHLLFSFGAASALNSDVNILVQELGEVQPTVLYSVPRVFNKVYDSIHKKVAADGGVAEKLFNAAIANSKERNALALDGKSSMGVDLKHAVLDKIVLSKVRAKLGGRLEFAFSGGAAISTEVMTFLDAVGIVVFEGYGLSETSPIACMNYPDNRIVGSVGKAIPGVEIFIDTDAVNNTMGEQGEILIKGPNVMQGYHNLDDKTAEVMRSDHAFRTGDLGRMDADGFVFITGRIKEQYKLENGKYVVPGPLEDQLQLSGYVGQAFVFGDNKLYNVALIIPDFEALKGWCADNGVSGTPETLCEHDGVRALIEGELAKQCQSVFKGFERIKGFKLIAEEFSVDNDLLTPKMSVKRLNVLKRYGDTLEGLYS